MPAQRIAENLAFINWTVLTGLAVGAFAAVVLGRLATTATRGYLAFTAACAVGLGGLAYLSDTGLPAAIAGAAVRSDAAWDGPRRGALIVFVVVSAVYTVALARGRRAPALAILGLVAGGAAIVTGAIGWAGGPVGILFLAIQLGLLAAATGGVFAAMILGHWYLVTPKLPEAPLVLFSRALFAVVAIQLVLFVAWVAAGTGGGARSGPSADRGRSSCGFGCSSGSASRSSCRGPRSRPRAAGRWSPRPASCTSTWVRSPPGRSSPRGSISAPACSSRGDVNGTQRSGLRDGHPGPRLDRIHRGRPVHPALAAIEAAAQPDRIPILDREPGASWRCSRPAGGGSARLGRRSATPRCGWPWPRRPARSIVTIDPDRSRTDIARGFWRQAGIAIGRIEVVNRPALEAFAANDAALAGPFDLVFIDALKPEYRAYVEALLPRLARGALVVADNVLWSGRVSGAKPTAADDESTAALRAFDTAMLRDDRFVTTILPVGDGLLVAHYRG